MSKERFVKIQLGDRWGSVNSDGQVFREPFANKKRRRILVKSVEPYRRKMTVDEIEARFFK
jgi:hypothetical protein